jgi:cbb3-type cytochrome oxidase subunit 3
MNEQIQTLNGFFQVGSFWTTILYSLIYIYIYIYIYRERERERERESLFLEDIGWISTVLGKSPTKN